MSGTLGALEGRWPAIACGSRGAVDHCQVRWSSSSRHADWLARAHPIRWALAGSRGRSPPSRHASRSCARCCACWCQEAACSGRESPTSVPCCWPRASNESSWIRELMGTLFIGSKMACESLAGVLRIGCGLCGCVGWRFRSSGTTTKGKSHRIAHGLRALPPSLSFSLFGPSLIRSLPRARCVVGAVSYLVDRWRLLYNLLRNRSASLRNCLARRTKTRGFAWVRAAAPASQQQQQRRGASLLIRSRLHHQVASPS